MELTARELEVTDVFIERKAAELHPFADRRQITPERERERERTDMKKRKSSSENRRPFPDTILIDHMK